MMRTVSTALGNLAARALQSFKDALALKAPTTHDGMIRAMALKAARAMMVPERKPRGDAVSMVGRGTIHSRWAGVFYRAPLPTRLNRSRKWAPAATYAEARERSRAFRVARDFGLLTT